MNVQTINTINKNASNMVMNIHIFFFESLLKMHSIHVNSTISKIVTNSNRKLNVNESTR